jgi:AcrR family transcriptional regulator
MIKKQTLPVSPEIPPKERILHTAQHLFYRNGVRATGIDRVIAEAKVTKVTFYRSFPSKDDLIEAFLENRHQLWMEWFRNAVAKSSQALTTREKRQAPLAPVFSAAKELFESSTFRGCAFANTVAEFGASVPSILKIASRHKKEVCEVIAALLPAHKASHEIAWAATLALDGAIVNAQTGGQSVAASLEGLQVLLGALTGERKTTDPKKSPRQRR